MVAVSLVLLLTVLEHANGIKTDHDPEIIEHPKDEYIGKRNLFLSWKYQTTSILQLKPPPLQNFSRLKIFENFWLKFLWKILNILFGKIENSTCCEQIKSAYAVIRCQAKYASGLDFKCNDDWLTNHKTRDIKHWKDDNGVEHVSGSIKIKACFHFHRFFFFRTLS